jgi:hypothetical protein
MSAGWRHLFRRDNEYPLNDLVEIMPCSADFGHRRAQGSDVGFSLRLRSDHYV